MADPVSLRLELFSRDVATTIEFLTSVLDFSLARIEASYHELRLGSVTVGVGPVDGLPDGHPLKAEEAERLGLGIEIVIESDDLDAAYDRARESGYPLASDCAMRPWGLRDFRLVSPDGYYIRVTSK